MFRFHTSTEYAHRADGNFIAAILFENMLVVSHYMDVFSDQAAPLDLLAVLPGIFALHRVKFPPRFLGMYLLQGGPRAARALSVLSPVFAHSDVDMKVREILVHLGVIFIIHVLDD